MSQSQYDDTNLMTVGQLAKEMNVTVRTLQYYDKENVLKPSYQSEGGRRLYSNKDMIKLHQILSMKYLGFTLDDIKNRIISLDTPEQVVAVLAEQAQIIDKQIANLNEVLSAILILKDETQQMQTVDFHKYADIIKLLQMKNEHYWMIKFFNSETMTHIRTHFNEESGNALLKKWQSLCTQTIELTNCGELPSGEKGQSIAQEWWTMVMDFTGGDMTMLDELVKFNQNKENWNDEWSICAEKQSVSDEFIGEALDLYLQNTIGNNPFGTINNIDEEVLEK